VTPRLTFSDPMDCKAVNAREPHYAPLPDQHPLAGLNLDCCSHRIGTGWVTPVLAAHAKLVRLGWRTSIALAAAAGMLVAVSHARA
jgi:hypothetical protein